MSVQKTYVPKENEITQEWFLVDAKDQNLGRLASQIATVLLGKNKPNFMPGMDTGNYVVVINCERIQVTGKKMDVKMYYRHSMYPSGLTETSLREQLERHPERVIQSAVWGMLPHNKYGRQVIRKMKVYAGPDHPHAAQNVTPLALGKE